MNGVANRRRIVEAIEHEKASREDVPFVPELTPQAVLDAIESDLQRYSAVRVARTRTVEVGCGADDERADDGCRIKKREAKKSGSERFGRHKVIPLPPWRPESELGPILKELEDAPPRRTYIDTILKYVRDKCDSQPSLLYRSCGVSRSAYSQLVSNPERAVSKETAVALALGMKLSYTDARVFLSEVGFVLSHSRAEDRVYIACLKYGCWNTLQVNDILLKQGLKKQLPTNFD